MRIDWEKINHSTPYLESYGMRRRALLHSLAAIGSAGLAGCLSVGTGSSDGGKAQIGAVGLANLTSQTYSVTVQIERNGERIHDETHEVPSEPDDKLIERTWPCEPAKFVIRAEATGDDEPREEVFTEEMVFDPDIHIENGGRTNITHNSVGQNECKS